MWNGNAVRSISIFGCLIFPFTHVRMRCVFLPFNSLLNMFSCQFLQLLRVTMALHVLPHICSNVYDIISLLFHPFQLTKATIMALSSTSEHNKKHWPKRLQEQCGLVFLFTACYCWLAHCCRSLWKVEKLADWNWNWQSDGKMKSKCSHDSTCGGIGIEQVTMTMQI